MTTSLTKAEAWALKIISRVQEGEQVEDSRVELKREWPDPEKAARRIAGHANACFGEEILWMIGLDEKSGIHGVEKNELSNWWSMVESCFDNVNPSLTDFTLFEGGKTIVVLLFETSRPPYVVKNGQHGKSGGGPVSLEVPWREGTSVKSATRNNLIRMLVPTIANPELEVLNATGALSEEIEGYPSRHGGSVRLSFDISLYLVPRSDSSVVIPFHRCRCVVTDGSNKILDSFKITMRLPYTYNLSGSSPDTATLEQTSSELIAVGPGKCDLLAHAVFRNVPEWLGSENLKVRLYVAVVDCELPVELDFEALPASVRRDELKSWNLH